MVDDEDKSNISEDFISSQSFIQNIFEELEKDRKYDHKLLEICKKYLCDNLNSSSSKKLVDEILDLSKSME